MPSTTIDWTVLTSAIQTQVATALPDLLPVVGFLLAAYVTVKLIKRFL